MSKLPYLSAPAQNRANFKVGANFRVRLCYYKMCVIPIFLTVNYGGASYLTPSGDSCDLVLSCQPQ